MPSASAVSSTERAIAAGGLAAVLERQRQLGAHAAHHHLRLGVLEDGADDARQLARAVLAQRQSADRELAGGASPPWKCGTRPQAARSSVDLPQPDTPASTVNEPGSSSSVDVVQRAAVALGVRVREAARGQDRVTGMRDPQPGAGADERGDRQHDQHERRPRAQGARARSPMRGYGSKPNTPATAAPITQRGDQHARSSSRGCHGATTACARAAPRRAFA